MNVDLIPIPYHLKLKMLILITEFGYFFFRGAVHRPVLSLLLILPLFLILLLFQHKRQA